MKKLILMVGWLCLSTQAKGQMCGDCDNDGKILVNELVIAVANSLNPPCYNLNCSEEDCCTELFGAEINGINYRCNIAACFADVTKCVEHLVETTPYCVEVD